MTRLHSLDWAMGLKSLLTTPSVTLSVPSKVKPLYSTEENSELMDISIHSVISLLPPGEDNESILVGPSEPPPLLGQDWEVSFNTSTEPPLCGWRQQSVAALLVSARLCWLL